MLSGKVEYYAMKTPPGKKSTLAELTHQLELLKKSGFRTADVLHKNSCFAAFVGIK